MIKKGLSLEEAFKALNGRINVNESKKKLKEEFADFPKLTDLAKGEVFTAYFGNHESCDFSYDSKKDTLIQKYYDPADTFKFKNIKTQTDFEKVVKDELGDGKITWEKKDSHKPGHLKNEAIKSEKVDLDYYDLEEVVKNIKGDLDFNLNIDDIIDYEMDEDGIVTIYLKDKKLIVDEYDNVKIIPAKPLKRKIK